MNLRNFDYDELIQLFNNNDLPDYRAEQLFTALYSNKVDSLDKITTFPKELRADLMDNHTIKSFKSMKKQVSVDGSIKYLFTMEDGKSIEAVFMPWYDDAEKTNIRNTLCISSQVGCSLDCKFCATGTMDLERNLETHEIISQILDIEHDLGTKITNVVFMGMGEPLLNYKNVARAVNILTHPLTDLMSRRKITVSTSGVVPNIKRMANLSRPPKLAISLHGTTNGFRDKIMPINLKADITVLMNAVEEYYRKTKLNITYEYIPFEGMNDTIEDAKRLAKMCKRVPSRINLIPFNDISFTEPTGIAETLKPSSSERIVEFANEIRSFGGIVTIRDTFGSDIDAACGQLALSTRNEKSKEN